MPRIRPVDPNTADPEVQKVLASVRRTMGTVPNLISTMAASPAVARAYLSFSRELSTGALPPRLREQVALAVSEANGCGYCLAAHTALGRGVGLSQEETRNARRGSSGNPRERAALAFALEVVQKRGAVSDGDVERFRQAGYSEGEVGEIVAHVALNVFTNYFNLVAQTEIDFPVPSPVGVGQRG